VSLYALHPDLQERLLQNMTKDKRKYLHDQTLIDIKSTEKHRLLVLSREDPSELVFKSLREQSVRTKRTDKKVAVKCHDIRSG